MPSPELTALLSDIALDTITLGCRNVPVLALDGIADNARKEMMNWLFLEKPSNRLWVEPASYYLANAIKEDNELRKI